MSLSLYQVQTKLSFRQHREAVHAKRRNPRGIQKTPLRLERRQGLIGVRAAFGDYTLKTSSVQNSKRLDVNNEDAPRIRRVLLKISGEALGGDKSYGIDSTVLRSVAEQIASCNIDGYQIAIVVGGGNFFRGSDAFEGINRVTADYVGMMATTMNAACLHSMLETLGVQARLQTAIEVREIAEPYIRRTAIEHLEKGRVVVFGAGTGSPFFTTDMAAAIRAAELNADEVLKATKVDGVYSEDPEKNKQAIRLHRLTYDQAMDNKIGVMDRSALLFCSEQAIPIRVFSLIHPRNISAAIRGDPSVGSMIQDDNSRTVIRPSYLKMEATQTEEKTDVHQLRWTNEVDPSPSYPLS